MASFERDFAEVKGEFIQEVDCLSQKITQLQRDNKQLKTDYEAAKNETTKVKTTAEKLIVNMIKAVEQLRSENKDIQNELNQCKSVVEGIKTSLSQLKGEVTKASENQAVVQAELVTKKVDIEKLTAITVKLDKKVTDLRKTLNDSKLKVDEKCLEITRISDDRSMGITSLRSKVSLLSKSLDALESDVTEVDKTCRTNTRTATDIKRKMASMEKQLKLKASEKSPHQCAATMDIQEEFRAAPAKVRTARFYVGGIHKNNTAESVRRYLEKKAVTVTYVRFFNRDEKRTASAQKGLSSSDTSFIVQESILHYKERSDVINVAFLDSSKAFDTVWHQGLLYKLYHLGIPDALWRIFDNSYKFLESSVLVNNTRSYWFPLSRGVRQGSVLSAKLYLLYIDELLQKLSTSKLGAVIFDIHVMAPTQADDIAIVSPVSANLQKMVTICERYSSDWRFTFSPSKSQI
ncbi:uncharacterized protein [Haliotis cracherodii]|uniref:uncharacterized protein n=1 Tax=Haliotis cracherodii TaxID=6455 RepID=UPI0039EBB48C